MSFFEGQCWESSPLERCYEWDHAIMDVVSVLSCWWAICLGMYRIRKSKGLDLYEWVMKRRKRDGLVRQFTDGGPPTDWFALSQGLHYNSNPTLEEGAYE